ncbi:Lsr2 dimerization domain-containing protein [Clavibacter michiganensis]|uniref:Lsr2 dimerization domain-containing protein n=1 Tax=Clavibacter michiganensis TaxID=28447 RepID=UPI0026DBD4EB|nr:histone-like nucleoid-structuring protein Lsr2 [Clavibacter michiganensis]MDO4137541.1 Lsr2 family protein [Clavibacter michiganensis]
MTDDVDPRDDSTDSTTEAVRFGLDGIVHEIDLDPAEARALRAALAPYVAAGRRTTVTITPIRDEPARAAPTGERAAARAWLEANGHKLGPGGRISATFMTLYRGRDGR